MTITVDGYTIRVSQGLGSVTLHVTDSGNCDAVDVALTKSQAAALGFGFAACVEELET